MSEWRLIETAPRDGMPILACGFNDGGWGNPPEFWVYVVSWNDDCWREAEGEKYRAFEPTHWMPFPEPPKP
jgi:hypothetical protein